MLTYIITDMVLRSNGDYAVVGNLKTNDALGYNVKIYTTNGQDTLR